MFLFFFSYNPTALIAMLLFRRPWPWMDVADVKKLHKFNTLLLNIEKKLSVT